MVQWDIVASTVGVGRGELREDCERADRRAIVVLVLEIGVVSVVFLDLGLERHAQGR